ncbi:hypothetical protein Htur_4814 (plasmid) [Haloterrigena turkmenica DSM 5511]|uniref:Uncharacterized protein n=1 Tax=Haloterrigena turkmenica (strain ATCC 51198 / DSM 5511 / JCM 9101 / NCIMB 13204 / VKM B-1734 / 4k) TaxID=543526 RepID=D2S2I4_HALTV|nr:hypothetical protein [Haloterrigena turkmenica]ADB63581.1 hypothetical protein Htur_4814 [Haloterrigena turkmenica DSM 5511]
MPRQQSTAADHEFESTPTEIDVDDLPDETTAYVKDSGGSTKKAFHLSRDCSYFPSSEQELTLEMALVWGLSPCLCCTGDDRPFGSGHGRGHYQTLVAASEEQEEREPANPWPWLQPKAADD